MRPTGDGPGRKGGKPRGNPALVVVVAAAAAALLVAVLSLARSGPAPEPIAKDERTAPDVEQQGARSSQPLAPVTRPTDPTARAQASAPPDARDVLGSLDPALVWRAQVGRAVQGIAQVRLGHPLAPADEARLLDALKSVGPAARGLDREELDPDDPASSARIREQTATLVAADRVARDLLGVGVAELLRLLDPTAIEDRGGASG